MKTTKTLNDLSQEIHKNAVNDACVTVCGKTYEFKSMLDMFRAKPRGIDGKRLLHIT